MYVVPSLSSDASTALKIAALERPRQNISKEIWPTERYSTVRAPLIHVVFALVSKVTVHGDS